MADTKVFSVVAGASLICCLWLTNCIFFLFIWLIYDWRWLILAGTVSSAP